MVKGLGSRVDVLWCRIEALRLGKGLGLRNDVVWCRVWALRLV